MFLFGPSNFALPILIDHSPILVPVKKWRFSFQKQRQFEYGSLLRECGINSLKEKNKCHHL